MQNSHYAFCAASCQHLLSPLKVHDKRLVLKKWIESVATLRSEYNWLLFFSVPKLLHLYHLLKTKDPNLEAIVHEISFLFSKEQAAWKRVLGMVEVSGSVVLLQNVLFSNLSLVNDF